MPVLKLCLFHQDSDEPFVSKVGDELRDWNLFEVVPFKPSEAETADIKERLKKFDRFVVFIPSSPTEAYQRAALAIYETKLKQFGLDVSEIHAPGSDEEQFGKKLALLRNHVFLANMPGTPALAEVQNATRIGPLRDDEVLLARRAKCCADEIRAFFSKNLKVFLSYKKESERFVRRVGYHLKRQGIFEPVVISPRPDFRQEIADAMNMCDLFVAFNLHTELGVTQQLEFEHIVQRFFEDTDLIKRHTYRIETEHAFNLGQTNLCQLARESLTRIVAAEDEYGFVNDGEANRCGRAVTEFVQGHGTYIGPDGLPINYPFDYEKDIIEEYVRGNGSLLPRERFPEGQAGEDEEDEEGDGNRSKPAEIRLEQGCPERWPQVEKRQQGIHDNYPNPVGQQEIGSFRQESEKIIVDARTKYHCPAPVKGTVGDGETCCLVENSLAFPEAGPRENLVYFQHMRDTPDRGGPRLKVAILVSGGIAPGINAVVAGIVERHELYREHSIRRRENPDRDFAGPGNYRLEVLGVREGFKGLSLGQYETDMAQATAKQYASKGGSWLGTSRYQSLLDPKDPHERDEALDNIIEQLKFKHIDILYVIGGDGSMRAAHAIQTRAKLKDVPVSVVAIPKTMDNDILWVWQSFGFLSAVQKATEFVRQLKTEARSNPRLCIVQLFGSDSGFVVSHAGLASGECDAVLIPEVPFTMRRVFEHIEQVLQKRTAQGDSRYAIVLVGETAIPESENKNDLYPGSSIPRDLYGIIEEVGLEAEEEEAVKDFILNNRRVHGQTPDKLRSGGLKMISRYLQKQIHEFEDGHGNRPWQNFRVFTSEPRHLVRAIDPSVQDIIFGHRLGTLAVDNAMAGYTDFMISQWLTEFVLVPLPLLSSTRL